MTTITAQAETDFRAWLTERGVDTLIHDACVAEAIDELDATDPAILYGHVYELPASCTRSGQPETYTFAPGEIEGDADPAVEYLDAVPLAEGREMITVKLTREQAQAARIALMENAATNLRLASTGISAGATSDFQRDFATCRSAAEAIAEAMKEPESTTCDLCGSDCDTQKLHDLAPVMLRMLCAMEGSGDVPECISRDMALVMDSLLGPESTIRIWAALDSKNSALNEATAARYAKEKAE